MARDRSTAYAEGARQGAPEATQVADRFHLLQNLAEALDQVFTTHGQVLNAVKAGVPLPWSTSPVEGHINRLKMLKRQMFGRARLDFLSRRFVCAPGRGRGHAQAGTLAA